MASRRRVLTGVRPTGPLHLGHYAGALEGWVCLQEDHEARITTPSTPTLMKVSELKARYVRGSIGDVAVKQRLVRVLEQLLAPIRERRSYFEARPRIVAEALGNGSAVGRRVAQETMEAVRAALRLDYTVVVSG